VGVCEGVLEEESLNCRVPLGEFDGVLLEESLNCRVPLWDFEPDLEEEKLGDSELVGVCVCELVGVCVGEPVCVGVLLRDLEDVTEEVGLHVTGRSP